MSKDFFKYYIQLSWDNWVYSSRYIYTWAYVYRCTTKYKTRHT